MWSLLLEHASFSSPLPSPPSSAPSPPPRLSTDDVAALPLPGCNEPECLGFGGEGEGLVAFLHSATNGSARRSLTLYESRTLRVLSTPRLSALLYVQSFAWARQPRAYHERGGGGRGGGGGHGEEVWAVALVLTPGSLFVYTLKSDSERKGRVLESLIPILSPNVIEPRLSPDARWLAFLKDDNVWMIATSGDSDAVQLSFEGSAADFITCGAAELVAVEEMDRHEGYWWSPTSEFLAYTAVKTAAVPSVVLSHNERASGEPTTEHIRYPFAGGPNAIVQVFVVAVAEAKAEAEGEGNEGKEDKSSKVVTTRRQTTSVDLCVGLSEEYYVARVEWVARQELCVQVQERSQSSLALVRTNVATSSSLVIHREEAPSGGWVSLHRLFVPIGRNGDTIVWGSETSGFIHLYLLCGRGGGLLRRLSFGEYVVQSIVGVCEAKNIVYFKTTADDTPLNTCLRAVNYGQDATATTPIVIRLSEGGGTSNLWMNDLATVVVESHSSLVQPPAVVLWHMNECGTATDAAVCVHEPDTSCLTTLGIVPPSIFDFDCGNGTILYGVMYQPTPSAAVSAPFPTVNLVYGGPSVQVVTNQWRVTVDLQAQYLRQCGVLVVRIDNRGTAGRGCVFESVFEDGMGFVELCDQVRGIHVLAERGLVDVSRVAVSGWSYGGFLAAKALFRESALFKAAVAGAPVTFWEGYNTHYTERYLGVPPSHSPPSLDASGVVASSASSFTSAAASASSSSSSPPFSAGASLSSSSPFSCSSSSPSPSFFSSPSSITNATTTTTTTTATTPMSMTAATNSTPSLVGSRLLFPPGSRVGGSIGRSPSSTSQRLKYERSSVLADVVGLRSTTARLLLLHGAMDDNVHLRHTMALVDALHRVEVDYELVLLPNERHVVSAPHNRRLVQRKVLGFLLDALDVVVPPER